jgi:hypothetical protein
VTINNVLAKRMMKAENITYEQARSRIVDHDRGEAVRQPFGIRRYFRVFRERTSRLYLRPEPAIGRRVVSGIDLRSL